MQRLNRGMMERYEIPRQYADGVNAVQFGAGEPLLGVVDRLIDDAGLNVGIACVAPEAAPLQDQDGMYTVLTRGYRGEKPVRREQVVQSIVRLVDPDAPESLAEEPGLSLALLDTASPTAARDLLNAARLLAARWRAGLGGLDFICLGETPDSADGARAGIRACGESWKLGGGFEAWLSEQNGFHPALADGLAFRAEAKEAAKLCGEMNYADAMIHIAEPYALLAIQAPEAFRGRWPLDRAEGARFVDDLTPELARKHRLFDAGLFALAAPGWLLGLDTLSDCMRHEALRRFVGKTYFDELLAGRRDADAAYVIQTFERFENPLNRNALLRCGQPLLARFARSALPVIRDWARENFEPPRRLSFALAATIMLYAGARPNGDGVYEVARGQQTEPIVDDPAALSVFASFSHDMPPETLAYAALADRELWQGEDLREIDGLEARVALDIANLQRNPAYIPEEE